MEALLVLIPAYNEEKNIAKVVKRIRDSVPSADILVVDDGSQDQTADVAESAGAVVVSHPFNLGYGVTIQTGYKYARQKNYDYLVQIDGDGQHDPSYIPQLLEPLQSATADFVLGSRFLGAESYCPSLPRRLGMTFFRFIVRSLVRKPITDCTSGYQAFNRNVIELFCRDIFPVDYPDADVLITLHRAGLRIREIPVRMYANETGKSMHSGLKPAYYLFKMLLSILITVLRNKKFFEVRSRSCR